MKGSEFSWASFSVPGVGNFCINRDQIKTKDEPPVRIAINTLPLLDNQAGAERYTRNIIKHLIRLDDRHQYHLFLSRINQVLYRPDQGSFRHTVVDVNTRNKLVRILSEQFVLPRLLKRQGVDLLFSPCNIGPRNVSVPMVVTLFDLHWLLFPELFSPLRLAYLRRALAWSGRKAAAILTISENSKKDLVDLLGLPEEKITVTYPGLDPIFEKPPSEQERTSLRKNYGLRKEFILFVGQLHQRKNVLRLIRAYQRLKQQTPIEHQLVLAGGEGDGSPEIREYIRHQPRGEIIVTGCIPDEAIRTLYHQAACLVYPSLYEGFGLPVLEAMACGCPVITSNVSSLPEVAGEAALLIDPYRVETIATALVSLLTNPGLSQRLIQKGFEQARRFTWEAAARKTIEVFEKVTSARG
jgi:glycosyltransferase involved in cell wall biosynthesis